MFDDALEDKIIGSIREEAIRLRYGKLYIEISVLDSNVIDIEIETKKRIHLVERKK